MAKLEASAALVAFDRLRRKIATGMGLYGAIIIGGGIFSIVSGGSGWDIVVIGAALFAEACYIRASRKPIVISVAGWTLAVLAIRLTLATGIAWLRGDPPTLGIVLIGGFLGIQGWILLKSSRTYETAFRTSDEGLNRQVQELVRAMRRPAKHGVEVVEWRMSGSLWRLTSWQNLFFLAKVGDSKFGFPGNIEQAIWLDPTDLRIMIEGHERLSRKLKVKLVWPTTEFKIAVTPEMLARLESMVGIRATPMAIS